MDCAEGISRATSDSNDELRLSSPPSPDRLRDGGYTEFEPSRPDPKGEKVGVLAAPYGTDGKLPSDETEVVIGAIAEDASVPAIE